MMSNICYMSSESEWCYCSQWTNPVGVGKYCAFLRDGLGVLVVAGVEYLVYFFFTGQTDNDKTTLHYCSWVG